MYQVRLQDLSRDQVLRFNEIKRMLKSGRIPAALLNPVLIKNHNANSPAVAKIEHTNQEVSIDSLVVRYVADGVEARSFFKHMIKPTEVIDEPDLPIYHDSASAKLDYQLDRIED